MQRVACAVSFGLAACAAGPADWAAARWETVHERPGTSLRGLAVVDARVVWASGSGGTVLRTTDGGRTWTDVAPRGAVACDFRDVHAFGADEAVVMVAGQPARLYRTTDGGASWTIVHEDPRPAAFFDAIAFAGDHGVLFGDPVDGAFTVLHSGDRGASWRAIDRGALPEPAGAEAAFAASGTCLCVQPLARRYGDLSLPGEPLAVAVSVVTGGAAARCLHNGGLARWAAVDLPLAHGDASQGAFSVAVRGDRGVVVGGDYRQPQRTDGTAAWSDDGGANWQPCAGGAGGYRSAVAWLDAEHVLAVGERGASLSRDRGRTWASFGGPGFHAVAAAGDDARCAVFACGSDGRIARLGGLGVEPRR